MIEPEHAADNRRQQIELYGEPLANILRSIGSALGLSQAEIATLLGLSAPMLSHLISARRVKIGNPVAGARLSALRQLAAEVDGGGVSPEEVLSRLEQVGSSTGPRAGDAMTARTQRLRTSSARDVQQVFRSVASAMEWIEVADLASERHPEIAELLRVYGAGRSDAADAHWTRVMGS